MTDDKATDNNEIHVPTPTLTSPSPKQSYLQKKCNSQFSWLDFFSSWLKAFCGVNHLPELLDTRCCVQTPTQGWMDRLTPPQSTWDEWLHRRMKGQSVFLSAGSHGRGRNDCTDVGKGSAAAWHEMRAKLMKNRLSQSPEEHRVSLRSYCATGHRAPACIKHRRTRCWSQTLDFYCLKKQQWREEISTLCRNISGAWGPAGKITLF